MKKWLTAVLLVVLLLCCAGAWAEETPALCTEMGFDYYISEDTEMGMGLGAAVVGYHLEEGQSQVFVPQKLGGMPVNFVETENLPQSVQSMVLPGTAVFKYPTDGRELKWVYYMDYDLAQSMEIYRALLPEMKAGDYELVNAFRVWGEDGQVYTDLWYPNGEELPADRDEYQFGHSLLWLQGETEDFTYATCEAYAQAEIRDFHLQPGQTQVFIPQELGGYPVAFIAFDKLPESVKTVFATQDFSDSLYITQGQEIRVAVCAVSETQKQVTIKEVMRVWADGDGDAIMQEPSYVPLDDLPEAWKDYTVKADTFLAGNCVFTINQFTGWPVLQMCDLPEGAAEVVVPPELNSYLAIWLSGNAMEDDIRVIYLPKRARGYLTDIPVGREYCLISYADYDMVMADEALRQQFGHMGKEDFVLLECKMVYEGSEEDLSSGDQQEKQVWFAAEDMPQEVQGHKLHTDLVVSTNLADISSYHEIANRQGSTATEKLMKTTFSWGGMLYTVNPYDNTASIVGYDLAEGQTELFVPPDFDGYALNEIEYELIPAQIKKVWLHEDCGVTILNYGEKRTNGQLLHYTYAVDGPDSIVLTSVTKDRWGGGGTLYSQQQAIKADEVPGEVAGRKVLLFSTKDKKVEYNGVVYSSNGWEYYLEDRAEQGTVAQICSCPEPEGTNILVVPGELDGYPVFDAIELDAIPESVDVICIKGDGSTWGIMSSGPVARTITCVNYTDWAGAAELRGGRPEGMQEDDLVWIRAMRRNLATEDQSWSFDQMVNAADMPGEINGHRVVFPEDSMDFYYTNGYWRYFRTKNYDNEVVLCLLQYTGPESKTIVIPKALDGYEVSSITTTALPETVEAIVCQSGVAFEPYQNIRYGQILSMGYQDYAAYVARWGKSALPNDANENDLIWGGASPVTFDGDMVRYERAIGEPIDATTLPKELDGRRVIAPYGFGYYYEEAGWQYCVTQNAQIKGKLYASIIGSNVPEGTTEMAVPQEMGGYEVSGIDIEAVPDFVTRLYVSADMTGFSPDFYRENELLAVQYMDWAFMAEHGWLDAVPGMAEDDLAWYNATRYTPEGKRMKADYNVAVNAEALPPEIDGHTMHFPMGIGNFVMSADGWGYILQPSYDDDTTVAHITASTGLEGQETVYIPSQVNGLPVARVELSALPESATTVYMPRRIGGFSTDEKRPDQLLVLEYTDWAGVQSEGALDRVPDMPEGDLALVDARIYEFKGQYNQYKDAQVNPEDLPAELFGKPCWNALHETQLMQ